MITPFNWFIPSRKISRSTSEMLNETYSHGLTISILTYFYEIIVCFKIQLTSPWASYQIRKIVGCACAGNSGSVIPATDFRRKPLLSDPDMHHGTCVTHVPWCMSGSLTRKWRGKRFRHSRRMHNPQFYVSGKRPMPKTVVWDISPLNIRIQSYVDDCVYLTYGYTTGCDRSRNIWCSYQLISVIIKHFSLAAVDMYNGSRAWIRN